MTDHPTKLLAETSLEQSPIVANCRMNRERELTGANGYARDLRMNPLDHLKQITTNDSTRRWLDLCCGTGRALVEAARLAEQEAMSIEIVGVDLVDSFMPHHLGSLDLIEASLSSWQPKGEYDLITCVHGLHYIGDKLGLLTRINNWLRKGGLFVGNLDLRNIRITSSKDSKRTIAQALRDAGFIYNTRTKLLKHHQQDDFRLPFRYLGASDQAGPNYTGQPAVDSYYEVEAAH